MERMLEAVVLGIFLTGCRPATPPPDRKPSAQESSAAPELARVGQRVITVTDFEQEMSRRARSSSRMFATESERSALLDEMIRFEVLYQRAMQAGYDRDPEMIERFRRQVVAKYESDRGQSETSVAVASSPSEIEAYYRSHSSEFRTPGRIHPAILFIRVSPKSSPEKQQEALARMETIRAEAIQQTSGQSGFGDLARRHSDDTATRYTGGDCGWVSRDHSQGAWPEEVLAAMFSLTTPGTISPVIRAKDGLYLIKLAEQSDPTQEPLETAREKIAWKLRHQKTAAAALAFLEREKKGLSIVIHPELLARIAGPKPGVAQSTPGAPPPTPSP